MGKTFKSMLLASILVCFLATNASAFVLLDPYAGLGISSLEQNISSSKYELSGTEYGIGARVAAEFLIAFAGLDFGYHSGSYKVKKIGGTDVSNADSQSYKHTMLGPVVGVDLPVLPLRGWVAYYLIDKMVVEDDGDDLEYKGSGYKVGVGFTAVPFLSINLEYIKHSYKELTQGSTTLKYSDIPTTDNLKQSVIMLSASVPLSL